jgi:hypothetical protein
MSGLVRVDFCDTVTGDLVGYGLVRYQDLVDCAGVVTSTMVREYFGLDDVSQGAGLPAGWEVCVPVSSGGGLSLVDADGGAIVSGDAVLRGMVFEDATPLDTDGLGNQVLELDCSMQKDGSNQIGVSSNYVKLMPFVALAAYNLSGITPAVDTILTSPISAPLVISNPCSDRDMEFMPFIEANTAANNSALNTGYSYEARTFYRVNGGAWLSAGLIGFEQHVPAGATLGAGVNSWSGESTRALDRPTFIIPAGGSVTIEGQCFFEVLMKLNNGPLQFGINVRLSGTGRLI